MSLKLWNTDINWLFLWSTAINQAFLWTVEVFSAVSNWLLNSLLSYYKADANGSFPDAQWSNNWTINGASFTWSWKINWAYNYDWINDFVAVDWLAWNPNVLSISTWFKVTWWAVNGILFSNRSESTRLIQLNVASDTRVIFQLRWSWNVIQTLDAPWLPILTWFNHVVAVFNKTTDTHKLYINWVLKDENFHDFWTESFTATRATIWSTFATAYWQFFKGTIDETWIWNKSLSDWGISVWQTATWDVAELYNAWAWLSFDNFTT